MQLAQSADQEGQQEELCLHHIGTEDQRGPNAFNQSPALLDKGKAVGNVHRDGVWYRIILCSRGSSARADCVPVFGAHHPSLQPIDCFGDYFCGSVGEFRTSHLIFCCVFYVFPTSCSQQWCTWIHNCFFEYYTNKSFRCLWESRGTFLCGGLRW